MLRERVLPATGLFIAALLSGYVGWHDFYDHMRGDGINGTRGITFILIATFSAMWGGTTLVRRG